MGRTKSVAEIVPFWLAAVKLERGAFAFSNNSRWIKPFLAFLEGGKVEIANVGPREVLAYRSALAEKHAPGTTNAYVMTAKRLVQWAAENEYRKPVMLTGVKAVRETEDRPSKAWTPEEVRGLLAKANRFNRQAFLWCAIGYLGTLRPSETMALILSRHGVKGFKAEPVSEGVWSIFGKTSHRSGLRRYLVLPPESMPLLEETKPCWTAYQCFWQGCNAAMDAGPHRFRHSSFQHLLDAVGPEQISTVELIGGHYSNFKVLLKHYGHPQWQALRKYGSMLAKNVPELACPAREEVAA